MMHSFKRTVVAGSSLMLVSVLAACSGGSGQQPAPQAAPAPEPQSEVTVNTKKDAAALPPCERVPDEAMSAMGLQTPGKEQEDILGERPPSCKWRYVAGMGDGVHVTALDRRMSDYYENPPLPFNSKRRVAGNPAMQANDADPAQLGICDVYAATQDDQMLLAQVTPPREQRDKVDSCQLAEQTLEAAFTKLPPAQ